MESNYLYKLRFWQNGIDEGILLLDIYVPSWNLKVGDTINIAQVNENKQVWDVSECSGKYEVVEIEQHYEKRYPRTKHVDHIAQLMFIEVLVNPL